MSKLTVPEQVAAAKCLPVKRPSPEEAWVAALVAAQQNVVETCERVLYTAQHRLEGERAHLATLERGLARVRRDPTTILTVAAVPWLESK